MNSGWAESRETRIVGLWSGLFPAKVLPHLLSWWVHFEDKGKRLGGQGKGEKVQDRGTDLEERGGMGKRQKGYEQTERTVIFSRLSGKASF